MTPAPSWNVVLPENPLLAAWQAIAILGQPTPEKSNRLIHHLHSAGAAMARQQGRPAPASAHPPRRFTGPLRRLDEVTLPRRLVAGRWLIRRLMGAVAREGRVHPTLDHLAWQHVKAGLSEWSDVDSCVSQAERDVWRASAPVLFLAAGIVRWVEAERQEEAGLWRLYTEWDWVRPAIEAAELFATICQSVDNRPADPAKRVRLELPSNFCP